MFFDVSDILYFTGHIGNYVFHLSSDALDLFHGFAVHVSWILEDMISLVFISCLHLIH